MHLRDGIMLPVVADVAFSSIRRMRRARWSLRHRQKLAAQDDLRQLRRRHRRRSCIPTRRSIDIATADPRTVLDVRRARSAMSASSCAVPRVAALDLVAEPLLAAASPRGGAGDRAAPCSHGSTCRTALGPAARHLLRRRAAARQHRPRLHHRLPILLLDEPTASLDAATAPSWST